MDSEDVIKVIIAIISIIFLIWFGWTIIMACKEKDENEKYKKQTYINLMLENERLKTIQGLEERN